MTEQWRVLNAKGELVCVFDTRWEDNYDREESEFSETFAALSLNRYYCYPTGFIEEFL
jgi:hypothetical protein